MKIYTGYYAKAHQLPDDVVPISISLYEPSWFRSIKKCEKLVPTIRMIKRYKENGNINQYVNLYYLQILGSTHPEEIVKELEIMGGGKDVCLLCYESSEKFCHRHIVSKWLNNNGIECTEYPFRGNKK